MRRGRTSLITLLLSLAVVGLWAQGRVIGPDWPSAQADAQLTSWQRNDPNISVANLSKPGFQLQWKERVEAQPRGARPLGQAVSINGVNLFMPVSLVAGAANRIYAIDNDTGFVLWRRQFEGTLPAPTAECSGGITGAAARSVNAALPAATAAPQGGGGGGGGRGGRGYQSMTGQPGEGAPIEAAQRGGGAGAGRGAPGAPAAAPPAAGAPAPGGGAGAPAAPGGRAAAPPARGGGGGLGRLGGPAYVISAAGTLHTVGWINGVDIQKPVQLLPANASYSDAVAVNNVLYLTTTETCGGAANAVWAVDLGSDAKPVASWKTNGGRPVGPIAVTPDGSPLVAIGAGTATAGGYANAIVALDPKTLQPTDWYTHRTAEFVTAPLVFRQGSRDVVAAATRDGRILLLDARSLGGANHSTPLFATSSIAAASPSFAPQALAMWQETAPAVAGPPAGGDAPAPAAPAMAQQSASQAGATWILAPVSGQPRGGTRATAGPITNGAVVALRVNDRGGRLSLQPGWTSRDIPNPLAPIVVNDVVFAASAGSASSTPAVLYAIDGRTGLELWNSGKTIESSTSGRSLWSANSQTYVATQDGTVYAFGFTLERR